MTDIPAVPTPTDTPAAVPRRRSRPARCEAVAVRGTGTGACDRLLDAHGYCDRPGDHLD